MTLYKWSQTAASDATADSSINWQEGQAPSSVNDSGRAMMAATAKYRDDIAGAIITGGTSTAYTVTSYEVFDTLAHMSGQIIAFTPHTTSGATVTLNVDGLGAKALRSSTGTELLAGMLIAGTPYVALYNNSDAAFYLQGFYGNPYNVPLAAGMDYWGATAPNAAFAIPSGQAISRTTYATLFALISTTYGTGNGSTTFNLPDKTGRTSAMYEPGGSVRLTSTYFGGNSTALGSTGGAESHTLTTAELAAHNHTATDSGHQHAAAASAVYAGTSTGGYTTGATTAPQGSVNLNTSVSTGFASASITVANAGSGNPHAIVQPTIICNYIMRVL